MAGTSLLTVACDTETELDLIEAEEGLEDVIPVERIALVEFDDGVEIEFVQAEDHVLVSELAPIGTFSRLQFLTETEESMTPLEAFMAMQPRLEPPVELVDDHEERVAERGGDRSPRRFSLPLEGARATVGGSVEYMADCTKSADLDWFRNTWQSAGWNWRYYYSRTATGAKYTPHKLTSSMYSHVCNYSVTDDPTGHGRLRHAATLGDNVLAGNAPEAGWYVPVGHRHFLWADGYGDWGGFAYKFVDAPGAYRLGVMAP